MRIGATSRLITTIPPKRATGLRLDLCRGSVRVTVVEQRQLRIYRDRVRLVPQVKPAWMSRGEQEVVVRIVRGEVHCAPRRFPDAMS